MSKRTVIFRADGGPSIGMGHFIRSLALAEMLNEDFQCVFATRKPSDYQIAEIEKVCHSRIDLPEDESHFERFLSLLKGNEIVVLDNYYFDTEYQRAIKEKGCKLVCIDDVHDKHYVADIVINHAPIEREKFSVESYTQLLLGFDYALLRSEFLDNSSIQIRKKHFHHALICIGGADSNNLTNSFLKDLIEIDLIKEISIITGNAYPFSEELKETIESTSATKTVTWYKAISSSDMKKLMNDADFGIVPCSTVLLEAISQRLPVISGYYVDNQIEIACNLIDKHRNIKILGDLNQQRIKEKHILKLSSDISNIEITQLITDENNKKFQKEFHYLSTEMTLDIRNANENDLDLYYHWANDSLVRLNAIHPEPIKYRDHVLWFNKKLACETTYMFVVNKENQPIGQIRFDLEDDYYLIDYSADSNYRGKGYGRVIIKMGIEQLLQSVANKNDIKLKALVKKTNIASAKVFLNLLFVQTEATRISGLEYFVFERS